MKPVDPEIEEYPTIQVGAGRDDVDALPAIDVQGQWWSFWELTDTERAQIAAGARVIVTTLHYGQPISPFGLQVETIIRACRECGCTDELACDDGCSWAEEDLCSACQSVPDERNETAMQAAGGLSGSLGEADTINDEEIGACMAVSLSEEEAARIRARLEEIYSGLGNVSRFFRFDGDEPGERADEGEAAPATVKGQV